MTPTYRIRIRPRGAVSYSFVSGMNTTTRKASQAATWKDERTALAHMEELRRWYPHYEFRLVEGQT